MLCARRTTPPALRATSPCTGEAQRFAPCHLPLHRGGWKILLRVAFPYTGETKERSVKSGHSPQISPRNFVLLHLRTFHRVLDGERQRLRRQRTHGADVRRNLPQGEGGPMVSPSIMVPTGLHTAARRRHEPWKRSCSSPPD